MKWVMDNWASQPQPEWFLFLGGEGEILIIHLNFKAIYVCFHGISLHGMASGFKVGEE